MSQQRDVFPTAHAFASPVESSVYFFEHHRFDSARVEVLEQNGTRLRVEAEVAGDIDALGLDGVRVESWLDFAGIYVQPDVKPGSIETARSLLAEFTDPVGLVGREQPHNFIFELPETQ